MTLTFQATEQKAETGAWVGAPLRAEALHLPTSPANQGGLSPSPLSIRQLKERVTNLRGKHKQIYNLVVKEVDPQVNWEALVEEMLVRPRLRLGWGRVRARSPPSIAWALESCCSRLFPDVCVDEISKAQRGAVPSPGSHSRCGGGWDPPRIVGVLVGWGQPPGFWPAAGLPVPSPAHLHPIEAWLLV